LLTVKKYKEAGVSLERIAQILHEDEPSNTVDYKMRPGHIEVVSRIQLMDGLELTDYDLRLLDERTINRLAFDVFPVFTAPIENWADKASTLTRVQITEDDGDKRVINVPTRTYFRQ